MALFCANDVVFSETGLRCILHFFSLFYEYISVVAPFASCIRHQCSVSLIALLSIRKGPCPDGGQFGLDMMFGFPAFSAFITAINGITAIGVFTRNLVGTQRKTRNLYIRQPHHMIRDTNRFPL